ncbi:TlpA family protein disulfide reductase [Mycolicibacillus parakoreensis]|uniref:TlpA family protein disulfide reductase n=1 Tax=Mycolicibacillus parakoreensis TaxID=1069221 RepID=A0ABY3TZF9_9MYCO|nr:TlpA disulfide reductase family protein [Mycolicibacillus parakoreensis]MCV7314581.1 TlpA family protein disulfide reductase [Mycolicibacillus parakoreensis]ULN53093.1 TlpA family protein disulfide reductase [Mycolicibacillus parakoreensis]HLR99828.1 TlpA disulfide reductase family protein [Mycolicibacillus parakoreensis]
MRWTVAVLAVVAALIVALALELRDDAPVGPPRPATPGAARDHRDADTPAALAEPRRRADLAPCPSAASAPGPASADSALHGVVVECAADGRPVAVAEALAGRPAVLNLWAYWCGPCRAELPAMAEYQRRVGPGVQVVTVHQDENETAGLRQLAELGVQLPTLQDGARRIAAALQVPNVMPATVVMTADGSVAQILPRPFASAEEIAAAVGELV